MKNINTKTPLEIQYDRLDALKISDSDVKFDKKEAVAIHVNLLIDILNRQITGPSDSKSIAMDQLLKIVKTEISETRIDHVQWLNTMDITRKALQPVSLYLHCDCPFLRSKAESVRLHIVESLVGCLEGSDSHVKVGIAYLLGEIGTKEAVKALLTLSRYDEPELRNAVNLGLGIRHFSEQRRNIQSLHR